MSRSGCSGPKWQWAPAGWRPVANTPGGPLGQRHPRTSTGHVVSTSGGHLQETWWSILGKHTSSTVECPRPKTLDRGQLVWRTLKSQNQGCCPWHHTAKKKAKLDTTPSDSTNALVPCSSNHRIRTPNSSVPCRFIQHIPPSHQQVGSAHQGS